MSEKGQSRRFGQVPATSDLPRTTDMVRSARHVSKVPLAEVNALIRDLGVGEERFFAVVPCLVVCVRRRRLSRPH